MECAGALAYVGQVMVFSIDRSTCTPVRAQDAWIRNATLRKNITFGLPHDAALYEQVCANHLRRAAVAHAAYNWRQCIDAAALRSDLDLLPAADGALRARTRYDGEPAATVAERGLAAAADTEIGERGVNLSGAAAG